MLGAKQTLDADQIVSQTRSKLESKNTPEGIRRFKRFFKEEISPYRLTSAQMEEIVKKHYSYIEGDMNLALIDRSHPIRRDGRWFPSHDRSIVGV